LRRRAIGIVLAIIRCALEPLGSVTWTFPPLEVSVLVAAVTAIGLAGGRCPPGARCAWTRWKC